MKRDMDLARQIMLQTEENSSYGKLFIELDFEDISKQILSEHVKPLAEAGLIESRVNPRNATVLPTRLTWEGHDFLEAAKNETIWQRAKKHIQRKGGAATFGVLNTVLGQIALEQFKRIGS